MAPTGAAIGASGIAPPQAAGTSKRAHLARRDIQGLRAIAVIVVILDHAIGWPSGGFVGVDIFFVLSGFLITGLLLREHDRTGRISIADFYRRRARRILPVSWVVLAATLFVALILFTAVRFQSTLVDAFWAVVFGINWHLAAVGTDYMQAAGPVSPLQHFWSLAVEEQFYLVWPLLLIVALVATRWVMRRRGDHRARISRRGVAVFGVVVVVSSFAWAMYETVASPTFAYFSTFSRAWELGIGALLAVGAGKLTRVPKSMRVVLAWVGIAGIGISLFVITPTTPFPAPWAALPVLATALVIASGIGFEARFIPVLTNRVSGYLGDISYSLYLWHFPAIVFIGLFLPLESPFTLMLVLSITFALSAFTFHFLEDPVRRSAWLEPRSRRAGRRARATPEETAAGRRLGLAWLAALVVVSSVVITAAVVTDGALRTPQASIVVQQDAGTDADASVDLTAAEVRTEEIATALSATSWPATDPALDALDKSAGAQEWITDECLNIYSNVRDKCIYGDPAAPKTAVLLGDSTAVSYLPGLLGPLAANGYKVHVLTMFSCPAYDVAVGPVGSEAARVCDLQHQWVFDYVAQLRPDMVLMSSLAGSVVKLASGTDAAQALVEYGTAAQSTIERLSDSSPDIVVIAPPPANEKPVTECKTPTNAPADCMYQASTLYGQVVKAEAAAVAAVPGTARYIDVSAWLCNRGRCPAFIGTAPVSWDGIHLTDKASEALAPLFAEALFPASTGTADAEGEGS